MNSKEKKGALPKLRFPEFRDAGEWEVKRLGEVCDVLDNLRKPVSSTKRKPGPYPYYGASGVIDYIDDYIFDERLLLIGEDGAKWGPYEKTAFIAEGKYWVNNHAHVLRPTLIIDALLENWFTASDMSIYVTGAAPPKLTLDNLKLIRVPVPPNREEQQKIADCLSSLDEVIELEAKKLEALKAHKKGLLQKLFPCEGETTPRLRFPEFRDAGEWEVKRLGEISEIVRGGSPRPITNYLTKDNDGLNWLKIGDVQKNAKYIFSTEEKINKLGLSKTRVVSPGDLIMSNSMSFGRPYILKIKTCIHDGWIAITKIREDTNRDYLYYLILSPLSQSYFRNAAAGSGVKNLNIDIIKLLSVPLPTFPEQQKIADCLSSFDEVIELQTKKLEALKAHKKGLMQKLFPSSDEVQV